MWEAAAAGLVAVRLRGGTLTFLRPAERGLGGTSEPKTRANHVREDSLQERGGGSGAAVDQCAHTKLCVLGCTRWSQVTGQFQPGSGGFIF